jgi:hypothetical protein
VGYARHAAKQLGFVADADIKTWDMDALALGYSRYNKGVSIAENAHLRSRPLSAAGAALASQGSIRPHNLRTVRERRML